MGIENLIQIICGNPELTREYVNEFQNAFPQEYASRHQAEDNR